MLAHQSTVNEEGIFFFLFATEALKINHSIELEWNTLGLQLKGWKCNVKPCCTVFYIPFIPLNKCLLWWLLLLSPIFIPFSLEYFIELLSAKVMEKIGILYISYVGSMYSFSLLSYWGGCAWVLEMPFNPRIQKSLNQKEAFRNNWPLLHAWLCQWPMKWMDDKKKKKNAPFLLLITATLILWCTGCSGEKQQMPR